MSAVSGNSLTVKGKDGEWTFAVDNATHVGVPGATRKTAMAKAAKEPLDITRYVRVGDVVSVTYHENAGRRHASDVLVRNATSASNRK